MVITRAGGATARARAVARAGARTHTTHMDVNHHGLCVVACVDRLHIYTYGRGGDEWCLATSWARAAVVAACEESERESARERKSSERERQAATRLTREDGARMMEARAAA